MFTQTNIIRADTCAWEEWTWLGEGPQGREGHTLELWDDWVVLFGGKSNPQNIIHIPRANRVEKVNGTLRFTGFIVDPLNECDGAEEGSEEFNECHRIEVGTYLNDLWAYNLGMYTQRESEEALEREI